MNTPRKLNLAITAVALIAVVALLIGGAISPTSAGISLLMLGAAFGMRDASIKVTKALPTAASGSVTSAGIDTGKGSFGDQVADVEYLLTAPALTTTMLPDTRTATYIIEHDDDSAFGTVATL